MDTLTIKVTYNGDTRRISFERNPSYAELVQTLKNLFTLTTFLLKYNDDDGDLISVTSEVELKEAISLINNKQPRLLRLSVHATSAQPQPSPASASSQQQQQQQQPGAQQNPFNFMNLINSILTSESLKSSCPQSQARPCAPFGSFFGATSAENNPENLQNEIQNLMKNLGQNQPWVNDIVQSTLGDLFKGMNIDPQQQQQQQQQQQDEKPKDENNNNNNNDNESNENVEHPNVVCDVCNSSIFGIRYKCTICHNYDLCSTCEKQGDKVHPTSHPLIKITNPGFCSIARHGPSRGRWMCQKNKHLSRYISDITVKDGSIFAPGTPFTKIWRVKNEGREQWPENTTLVWISGERFGSPEGITVESVLPGQDVDIAINLSAPTKAGHHMGYWKLFTPEGLGFGQRLNVDIHVVEEQPSEEPSSPAAEVQKMEEVEPSAPVVEAAPVPVVEEPKMELDVFEVEDDDFKIINSSNEQPAVEQPVVSAPLYPNIPAFVQAPIQQLSSPILPSVPVIAPVIPVAAPVVSEPVVVPAPVDPLEEKRRSCVSALVSMGFGNIPNLPEIIKRFNYNVDEIVDHILNL